MISPPIFPGFKILSLIYIYMSHILEIRDFITNIQGGEE